MDVQQRSSTVDERQAGRAKQVQSTHAQTHHGRSERTMRRLFNVPCRERQVSKRAVVPGSDDTASQDWVPAVS